MTIDRRTAYILLSADYLARLTDARLDSLAEVHYDTRYTVIHIGIPIAVRFPP